MMLALQFLWALARRPLLSIPRLLGLVALLGLPRAGAQPPPGGAVFAVGFLAEGSDVPEAAETLEQLRQALARHAGVQAALGAAGLREVVLSPCDGPRDLGQRLAAGEFHLAFGTALTYAQQALEGYTPILQTQLPGDFRPPRREAGVLRRGVLFAGPASPLFAVPDLTSPAGRAALVAQLRAGPIAVTAAESAAGYVFPRLKLQGDYGLGPATPLLFCGSDAEVVKHVVSGLLPVGACRKGAIDQLIPAAERVRCVRELFETEPFPSDPILLRNDVAAPERGLQGVLKGALREFFNLGRTFPNGLRLSESAREDYAQLAGVLRRELAAPTPAGAPEPTTGTLRPVLPPLTPAPTAGGGGAE